MKTTLFMAVSVNGYVADTDGGEDFLSHENWLTMKSFLKEYGNMIWGRKTYEAVQGWGSKYMDDLVNIDLVVLSKDMKNPTKDNVTYSESPAEALRVLRAKNYEKAFLSGGATLNSAFLEAKLINELILNVNPVIVSGGIPLFKSFNNQIYRLKFQSSDEIKGDILQLRYKVIY
ncbi:hypothetical protein GF362_01280 [Candidatus Dojkabacteria bacterium]|nr:hypothetical protein [Candidatus Dojkabacteria bacterium]